MNGGIGFNFLSDILISLIAIFLCLSKSFLISKASFSFKIVVIFPFLIFSPFIEIRSKFILSSLLEANIEPIQNSIGLNLLISISFSTISLRAGLCTLPPRANLLTFFHRNSEISYPIR